MRLFTKPSEQQICHFLERQTRLPFSYKEVGATAGETPSAFDRDHNRVRLGTGPDAFAAARKAIAQWGMFPAWTEIHPAQTKIETGNVVVMLTRIFGFWWMNACRIVYVIDEAESVRRFGFAYGTLPGHVEMGEERFTVEHEVNDEVWYDLLAFSKPRHPLVRLGYPLARRLQKRFVIDSQAAMRRIAIEAPRDGTGGPA
jgi:uncharacterized protein (UPF0548 family)